MDKNTLSNYGWIVIAVLVLSVMIALATPFGQYVENAVWSATEGLFDVSESALNIIDTSTKEESNKSIFEMYDMADNGTFESSGFAMTANGSGSSNPYITNEAYNTIKHSLKCFGNVSKQKRTNQPFSAGEYYVACKIRVDRYVQGYAGVLVNNGGNKNVPIIQVTETTNNKFITASGTFTTDGSSNFNIFYGTINSADMDCYIDDLVIVPLSAFTNKPSVAELDAQYEEYISLRATVGLNDEQYISGFMDKVNAKANSLGMSNSAFVTPSGVSPAGGITHQYSTAEDIMKLTVAAYQNDTLRNFWSVQTKDISVDGPFARTITLDSTYVGNDKSNYTIMGGKTGTIGSTANITAVTEINGKTVIGVIMGATDDDTRFAALNELFDVCTNVLTNNSYDTSATTITNSPSAIACVVTDSGYDVLYEQNKDSKYIPASITKVITLLTALDYIDDLETKITITDNNITEGSGSVFVRRDIISYEEAFYAMMLPSSNTAATAVATNIGSIIIN